MRVRGSNGVREWKTVLVKADDQSGPKRPVKDAGRSIGLLILLNGLEPVQFFINTHQIVHITGRKYLPPVIQQFG